MKQLVKWQIRWVLSWLTPFVLMVLAFAPFFIA